VEVVNRKNGGRGRWKEKQMTIRPALRDELLKACTDPREVLAEGGLIKQLTKAIIERC